MRSKLFRLNFVLLIFLIFMVSGASSQEIGGYQGIPWNSSFPVIEKKFPDIDFVEEDPFHVTLFRVNTPGQKPARIEFKLFEEQLISVIHYYDGPITALKNDNFVGNHASNLGPRQEIRNTTANSLAGAADVEIWEYKNNLVLFRSYPPGQKEGFVKKENSIVFIYKPTFDKMIYHRKHSQGDIVDDIIDYDYVEF